VHLYCGQAPDTLLSNIRELKRINDGCAVTDMGIGLRHVEHDVNNEGSIHSHEVRVT
jgi:hypothetical protein